MTPPKAKNSAKKEREIKSSRSLSTFVKSICDIMRRSNCASALQYVPELTWILFLRILEGWTEGEGNEGQPFPS
jgi:type I restriction enzyme M protein